VKKLKEIKVEGSHKAQGIEVFFAGARRVAKVYWVFIKVCAFVRRFPSRDLGFIQGGPKKGRERETVVFSPPSL
jgi:hypothetical protein